MNKSEYDKRYRKKHKEKYNEYQKKYQQQYRATKPEKVKTSRLKYYKSQVNFDIRDIFTPEYCTIILEALHGYQSKEPKANEVIKVILKDLYGK